MHVTFCQEDEWHGLGEAGWLRRMGMQFHWENAGYSNFDDFLGALSSRKRKVLRRERRDANAAGLRSMRCRGPTSRKSTGMRSFGSTTRRSIANGVGVFDPEFFSLLASGLAIGSC